MKHQNIRYITNLAIGAFMISFSGVFVKLANTGPIAAGFYRVLFGGIFLLLLSIIRWRIIRIKWRDIALAFVCGASFAIDLTCFHKSVHAIGPGLATVLGSFQVFFLAAFGIIVLKEKFTIKMLIAIILAMLGILLLVGPSWNLLTSASKLGVILGISTAAAYASYILMIRRLQTDGNLSNIIWNMALVSLFTASIMALAIFAFNETFIIPDNKSLLSLISYGFVAQTLGWILISSNLPNLKVSTAGLILLLQPSLSFIWDILFFARPTTFIDILGACIALTAIYLGSASRA